MKNLRENFVVLSFSLLLVLLLPGISIGKTFVQSESSNQIIVSEEQTLFTDDLFDIDITQATWETNYETNAKDVIKIKGTMTPTKEAIAIWDNTKLWFKKGLVTWFYISPKSKDEVIDPNNQSIIENNLYKAKELSNYITRVVWNDKRTLFNYCIWYGSEKPLIENEFELYIKLTDEDVEELINFRNKDYYLTFVTSINIYSEENTEHKNTVLFFDQVKTFNGENLNEDGGFISFENPYFNQAYGFDPITPSIDPIVEPENVTPWLWILLAIIFVILIAGIILLIFYRKNN